MKQNRHLRQLTLAALLAAFTTVATLLIQIPTPTKGYLNLGDCFVNISAWLLGGVYGTAAAGIGSALADVISGYFVYAPVTLVIKAFMALASFHIYQKLSEKHDTFRARIAAACIAEVIMIIGYAGFEAVMYQSLITSLLGIPSNLVQGIMGAASSITLYELVIKRIPHLNVK